MAECSQLPEGGYTNDLVDEPSPDHQCPVCFLPLRLPQTTDCCGGKFCDSCIRRSKAAGLPCPICRKEFNHFVDKRLEREVLGLKVYCSRKDDGCTWEGELRHANAHESNECGWALADCRYLCGAKVSRCQLAEHENHVCPERPTEVKVEGIITAALAKVMEEVRQVRADVAEFKAMLSEMKETQKELAENITEMKSHLVEEGKHHTEHLDQLVMSLPSQIKPILKDQIKEEMEDELIGLSPSTEHSEVVDFPEDQEFVTNRPLQFSVVVRDNKGRLLTRGAPVVVASELMATSGGTAVQGTVTLSSDSQYKVTFSPPFSRGRYSLSVSLNGKHIAGCTRDIFISYPVTLLGTNEPRIIPFDKVPWCATLDSEDRVYLPVDTKIYVYNSSGESEKILNASVSGSIAGMTADDKGFLYVTDSSHTVVKLDENGRFVKAGGTKGAGKNQFSGPDGIVFSKHTGYVYVSDTYNHRIQVLTQDLDYVKSFKVPGATGTNDALCKGIAVDEDSGEVYGAVFNQNCIRVFSADGEALRVIGQRGTYSLTNPRGICLYGEYVFVTELESPRRVVVFKKDGTFVHSFEYKDMCPFAVMVDKDGFVYVCDGGRRNPFGSVKGTRVLVF